MSGIEEESSTFENLSKVFCWTEDYIEKVLNL